MKNDAPQLGNILKLPVNKDAIHIAIAPVYAIVPLEPGEHIGLDKNAATNRVTNDLNVECIGIVDPFLKNNVKPGQQFYMLLYPNTVTGLSHLWSHPVFPKEKVVTENKFRELEDKYYNDDDDYSCSC